MRIKKLKLFTHKLESEKQFYSETLGFELIEETSTSFTLKIGWSELTFVKSEQHHIYHYCFLIPSNKLNEALDWMEKRVSIVVSEEGTKTHRFETWNADAFYFYDASGNIVEFIVRYDLNNESDADFSISDVLCVNEIGMPTNDVEKSNGELQEQFGTKLWKGDLKRFATNGNQEGLFLLPNYELKDFWFPTSVKIRREPFEIHFENDGKIHFTKVSKNHKKMKLEYLADNTDFLPTIAKWYHEEWGHLLGDQNAEDGIEKLRVYLNKDKIPLMLVAVEKGKPVGVAQLKYREMSIYPEKTHWLGGVYVSSENRGKNIATQVVQGIIDIAKTLNVETLYLQTENLNGGLYRKMGWEPIEQVHYGGADVLVMEKNLPNHCLS